MNKLKFWILYPFSPSIRFVHHWRNFKIDLNPMDTPNPPIMPAFSYKGKAYYDADCKDPYVEGVTRFRKR